MKHDLTITTTTDRDIVMTRTFEAPRERVFDAWTRPELLKRWLAAGRGWSMVCCEIDLRVGGGYRLVWRGPDGYALGMRGSYLEIVEHERLVSTERFDERWYAGEAIGTLVITERDGLTIATSARCYDSKAVRDSVLRTPIECVLAGYDALDDVLAAPAQEA
ncbi:MAG: SRPBCC family protein [Kofleriaceae bacterium]